MYFTTGTYTPNAPKWATLVKVAYEYVMLIQAHTE